MVTLGIALLLAGAILAVAEVHLPTGGLLGATGTVAAVGGAVLAVEGSDGGALLAVLVGVLVALVLGGFIALVVKKVAQTAHGRPRSGHEALVGRRGVARTALAAGQGRVFVDGALWQARPSFDDDPVLVGDEVVVERVDGLVLTVRKAESWELLP